MHFSKLKERKRFTPTPKRGVGCGLHPMPSFRLVRGFTLVEILVVVAVTALISAFVITYSSIGRRQSALYGEEAKIAGYIFRAKSLAITTKRQDLNVPCGYGAHFDYEKNAYSLFSYSLINSPGSDSRATSTCSEAIGANFPADFLLQPPNYADVPNSTSTIAAGVTFLPGPQRLDFVFFLAPDPQTLLARDGGNLLDVGSGNIYLGTTDGKATKTINLTAPLGQVDL